MDSILQKQPYEFKKEVPWTLIMNYTKYFIM